MGIIGSKKFKKSVVDKTAILTVSEAESSDSGVYNVSVGRRSKQMVVEVEPKEVPETIEVKEKENQEQISCSRSDEHNFPSIPLPTKEIEQCKAENQNLEESVDQPHVLTKLLSKDDELGVLSKVSDDSGDEYDLPVDMDLLKDLMYGKKVTTKRDELETVVETVMVDSCTLSTEKLMQVEAEEQNLNEESIDQTHIESKLLNKSEDLGLLSKISNVSDGEYDPSVDMDLLKDLMSGKKISRKKDKLVTVETAIVDSNAQALPIKEVEHVKLNMLNLNEGTDQPCSQAKLIQKDNNMGGIHSEFHDSDDLCNSSVDMDLSKVLMSGIEIAKKKDELKTVAEQAVVDSGDSVVVFQPEQKEIEQ